MILESSGTQKIKLNSKSKIKLTYLQSSSVSPPDKIFIEDKSYNILPGFKVYIEKGDSYRIESSDPKSYRIYKKNIIFNRVFKQNINKFWNNLIKININWKNIKIFIYGFFFFFGHS